MIVDKFARIQYLSRNYTALQGLKHLPVWVLLLVIGMGMLLRTRSEALATLALLLVVAGLVAAPFLYLTIRSYYEARYGYARVQPERRYTALLLVGVLLDTQLQPPFSVFSLFVALYCLHNWRQAPALRRHYLVFAIIMAMLSPLVGFLSPLDWAGVVVVVSSVLNLVGAVLDHLLLAQLVRQAQEESPYANSV